MLPSLSGEHLVPIFRQAEAPATNPSLRGVNVEQPAYTGVVRPDQTFLPFKEGTQEKAGPDRREAFSVSCRADVFGRDEASSVVAHREDALVRLFKKKSSVALDGSCVSVQN